MLRSLRTLYAYTVLVLTYLGNRAAKRFMHKCIFFGARLLTGVKKPAVGGLIGQGELTKSALFSFVLLR